MFRNVQIRVHQSIGQSPWMGEIPALPRIYLKGTQPASTEVEAAPYAATAAFDRERVSERKTLQAMLQQIGDPIVLSGGLFHNAKKWTKRKLTICFLDGSRTDARTSQASPVSGLSTERSILISARGTTRAAANRMNRATLPSPSFGEATGRIWEPDSATVPIGKPTLALASVGLASEEAVVAGKFNREILHEFGHAVGFDHTWRAPPRLGAFSCDDELDWDHIYQELAKQGWSKETVDANLRSKSLPGNVTGAFDKHSIMN